MKRSAIAICYSELIRRMRGGLVHHIIKIPAALSLPLLRDACSMSCTDNISKKTGFVPESPIFPSLQIFRLLGKRPTESNGTPAIDVLLVAGQIFETKNRAIFSGELFSGEEFLDQHYCPNVFSSWKRRNTPRFRTLLFGKEAVKTFFYKCSNSGRLNPLHSPLMGTNLYGQ